MYAGPTGTVRLPLSKAVRGAVKDQHMVDLHRTIGRPLQARRDLNVWRPLRVRMWHLDADDRHRGYRRS